jgi:hypothetical protein
MLEITLERKARSMSRRQAGPSGSSKRVSLRRRITPGDGNETDRSSGVIDG